MRSLALPCLALLCLGAHLHADVIPAPLFTDNAVLQRDKPIPVWGTADAGEKVAVSFGAQTVATSADADGKWLVTLPASAARTEPTDLVIQGNNTITLGNIVVGEVWIASGQSNMEWVVSNTYDKAIDVPASERNPLIRHIKIKHTVADVPADTVTINRAAWEIAGPRTTGNFSAVGYYFAKDIHALTGVPVGIIGSNWGGTRIEAWLNAEAYGPIPDIAAAVKQHWDRVLANYPAALAKYETEHAAWVNARDQAKTAGKPFTERAPPLPAGPGHRATPSGLYNGMIQPLVPYAIRGAIWYQGESNAGRPQHYRALQSALIEGWREQFGQGDFPFYWVQLANYHANNADGTGWAFLREAQTQTLALPATGQAVIIDIGDVRDIHPRNKKDVGRRLARLALKNDYGFDQLVAHGPTMKTTERDGTGFKVTFTHTDGGLIAPLNDLGGFELAGEGRVFKPATAEIKGNTVIVTSAEITEPVAVRYAWRNAPLAGLFNKEGLPAVPFRSDNW